MRWKHVFIHVSANAYMKMEMKQWRWDNELYSHFWRKKEVKIHGKQKWYLLVFSKYDFWSKSDLLDAITRKTFRVIVSCEWKRKVRWVKMEVENGITCICGWRMGWKTCNRISLSERWSVVTMECERWQCFRM